MSVTPLDRTDQTLIRLVNELGDPLVPTQALAEEVELGFQQTLDRLETLEEQGWIQSQRGDGQRRWQVSSKASLLVRTDSEPPSEDDADEEIIDADEADGDAEPDADETEEEPEAEANESEGETETEADANETDEDADADDGDSADEPDDES